MPSIFSFNTIKIKHSINQKSYVYWKLNELQEHVSTKSIQEESRFDKRYGKTYTNFRFYTNANTDIETINKEFYKSGSKVVTQEILDKLTPLSLAVWYMDDGHTSWSAHNRNSNCSPECKLCTDSFSKEECELICKWFDDKYGIKCHIRLRKRDGNDEIKKYRVILKAETVNKFLDLIRPYIIPEMMYKVDYNAWKEKSK